MRKRFSWLVNFNWRMLLMRIVINAISLLLVAALVPDIYFAERSIKILLIVSITLGIINAIVKPLIQFLTFQLIFASYGIVIVLINAVVLWLLSVLFPQWFVVNKVVWAFVGGALLGGIGSFLEALFGLTLPIVPAEDVELRALIKGESGGVVKTLVDRKESKLEAEVASKTDLATDQSAGLPQQDAEALAVGNATEPETADGASVIPGIQAGDQEAVEAEPMPINHSIPQDNTL